MIVIPTKHFKKKANKLPKSIKIKLNDRIHLFMNEPKNILLNNHKLNGLYAGYRSINITGDYRMIYEELEDSSARLIDIGTHAELY